MIRKRFSYHAPASAEQAADLLASSARDGETAMIGGGTWVVAEMTSGTRSPSRVIDLGRAGLKRIDQLDGSITIGATTTYRDLIDSRVIDTQLPMLRSLALAVTGGSQIWNRGTLGGSACYANPNSDAPTALVALRATMRLRSAAGTREVSASAFFRDAYAVDLADGELLEELVIAPPQTPTGYYKFKLCEGSWPVVTGAYVAGEDGGRVTLGGVQATPLTVSASGASDAIVDAVDAAVTDPRDDTLASGQYKKSIAGVIARRTIEQADVHPRRR